MSSTSMDHLDELRVATASSLPLNGLAPRTYARDHVHAQFGFVERISSALTSTVTL